MAPSAASSQPPLVWLDSKTVRMAKAYSGSGSSGNEFNLKSGNLSTTLEKLYAWEKKLYKEVKVLMHISFVLNFLLDYGVDLRSFIRAVVLVILANRL